MIAPTFILRVLSFLLAAVIVMGGILAVWFVLTYVFKLMIDGLEASNRAFFVWLREKWPFSMIVLRRKRRKRRKDASV